MLVMQTVHFIRHGEGFHNIGYDGNLDAHLTPFGWTQAHALNDHLQSLQRPTDIQVLLLSPCAEAQRPYIDPPPCPDKTCCSDLNPLTADSDITHSTVCHLSKPLPLQVVHILLVYQEGSFGTLLVPPLLHHPP